MESAHGVQPGIKLSLTAPRSESVEARLDEALEQTFPASDPVSIYLDPRTSIPLALGEATIRPRVNVHNVN